MMPVRRSNQTWLPSIFNDFFDNDWMVKANATAPAINVIESDKDYKVEVAAPGMTKEDFKIHINEDNDLVISMEIAFGCFHQFPPRPPPGTLPGGKRCECRWSCPAPVGLPEGSVLCPW